MSLLAIFGTFLLGIVGFFGMWAKQQTDQHAGADLEAGKVSEVSAKAEAKIAQAVTDAPHTRDELLERLKSTGPI
jgi:hypothetical protein